MIDAFVPRHSFLPMCWKRLQVLSQESRTSLCRRTPAVPQLALRQERLRSALQETTTSSPNPKNGHYPSGNDTNQPPTLPPSQTQAALMRMNPQARNRHPHEGHPHARPAPCQFCLPPMRLSSRSITLRCRKQTNRRPVCRVRAPRYLPLFQI
jgi:hypothetical protein